MITSNYTLKVCNLMIVKIKNYIKRKLNKLLYSKSLTTEEIFKNPYFQEWIKNPTLENLKKYYDDDDVK